MNKEIQKILLIQPPLTTRIDLSSEPKGIHPPLGLAYIGAVLEKDYEVQIIDSVVEGYDTEIQLDQNLIRYGLSYKEIEARVETFKPDVVGISNIFSSGFREALQVAEVIKEINPEIITVIGGPHPSALPADVLQHHEIDYVVLGEGEYSFKALLRGIERQKFSGLDGVAYRKNGKVRIRPN